MGMVWSVVLIGLTVISTGYFTYLTFRKGKFWEYKVIYYTQIIEHLYHIKKYFDYQKQEYFESMYPHLNEYAAGDENEIDRESRKQLQSLKKGHINSLKEIDKLINITEYIIDGKATEKLIHLLKNWNKLIDENEEVEDAFERESLLINDCIKNIKEIRKNDLETRAWYQEFWVILRNLPSTINQKYKSLNTNSK